MKYLDLRNTPSLNSVHVYTHDNYTEEMIICVSDFSDTTKVTSKPFNYTFSTTCDDIFTDVKVKTEEAYSIIYPNPVRKDQKLYLKEEINWSLFNTSGVLMSEGKSSEVAMNQLNSGIYYLQLGDGSVHRIQVE